MAAQKRKRSAPRDELGRFLSKAKAARRAKRAKQRRREISRPRDKLGRFLSNEQIEKRRRKKKLERERKKKRPKRKPPRRKPPKRKPPKRKPPRRPKPKPKKRRKPKKPPRIPRQIRERSDEWAAYFRELLDDACRVLEIDGHVCDWSVKQNLDASVDGQLRLEAKGDEELVASAAIDLENAANWSRPGYWITLAAIVDSESAAEDGFDYPINAAGEFQVTGMFPVKSVNAGLLFLDFRIEYLTLIGDSVVAIILRVNWNPEKKQPARIR